LEIKFRPFSVFLDDVDRLSSDSLKAASFKDELPEIEARIRQEENMARQRQFFASVQARNAAPAPLEDDSEIAWAGGIGAPLLMQAAGLADVLHDFAIPDLYPDLFAMNALGWNSIASALNATEALYRSVPGSDQNEITGDRTNFVSGERFLRHQEKRHREKAKFKGTDSIIPKEALSA
jgi:hypothetical protein